MIHTLCHALHALTWLSFVSASTSNYSRCSWRGTEHPILEGTDTSSPPACPPIPSPFPHPAREPARPPRRPSASTGRSTLLTPSSVSISSRQIVCQMLVVAISSVSRQKLESTPSFILLDHPLEGQMHGRRPFGDLRRVDWTASDGAKGRDDVRSRLLVLRDLDLGWVSRISCRY